MGVVLNTSPIAASLIINIRFPMGWYLGQVLSMGQSSLNWQGFSEAKKRQSNSFDILLSSLNTIIVCHEYELSHITASRKIRIVLSIRRVLPIRTARAATLPLLTSDTASSVSELTIEI